ncbi:MAG: tetratricopeptide repeat protein [Desulfobacterota bacterium]|nr:tetratricopeptide repeat protein [Thermodesulfobacteriota bacterium]
MRKLFEEVQVTLSHFIDQRDHLFMIIGCRDFETAYILKILQGIDESNNSDLFWMFADEFKDLASYVETVIGHFKTKYEGVCEGLKKEGKPPWPPIPQPIFDPAQDPVLRLKGLMEFSRALLPSEEGHLSIWAFFPFKIHHPLEYQEMVKRLMEHQFPVPWCHHMRIFFRDEKDSPLLHPAGTPPPRVSTYSPDLGVEAMERSLREEVMDGGVPLDQRLQSLLSLAGLDLAHGRFHDALPKYKLLLSYYQGTGQPAMTALVLNWIGDVFMRLGDLKEAQRYYESSLTPAIESKSEPVLLNILLNLGHLKAKEEAWEEAEIYYESAEKIATALRVPQAKILCLENRGLCQAMQKNIEKAIETWKEGATLARAMEEKFLLQNILLRLKDCYQKTGKNKEFKDVVGELETLRSSHNGLPS